MRRRQPLPTMWLFTDERLGERLWAALDALPAGGGVILRHYSLGHADRLALGKRLRAATHRRRQVLLVAGGAGLARAIAADGVHLGRSGRAGGAFGLVTAAACDRAGLVRARRAAAELVFVSPAFTTASHPGAPGLGRVRFGLLAVTSRVPVAALGGVDAGRARHLPHAAAWGAVGALADAASAKRQPPTRPSR